MNHWPLLLFSFTKNRSCLTSFSAFALPTPDRNFFYSINRSVDIQETEIDFESRHCLRISIIFLIDVTTKTQHSQRDYCYFNIRCLFKNVSNDNLLKNNRRSAGATLLFENPPEATSYAQSDGVARFHAGLKWDSSGN